MIKVFDNILSYAEVGFIQEYCLMTNWTFGHEANPQTHIRNHRMVSYFPLEDIQRLPLTLSLQNILQQESIPFNVLTSYVNYYTSETATAIHSDAELPNFYTAIYFANSEWNPQYGGELLFYNDDLSEVIKGVICKPNRLVIFDSRIPHCAKQPIAECPFPRFTIAYKLGNPSDQI
jgi:hypothetical protein